MPRLSAQPPSRILCETRVETASVPDLPGEFDLIAWIREQSLASPMVPIGIGDDAALVRTSPAGMLVTTDMLMDGVDFDLRETPPELAGRKSLAVNLSDIAAMAGSPLAAFISLALPRQQGRHLAEGLYRGICPLAEEFHVAIAGGDTNSWDGPLVINITVLGQPSAQGPVLRSGAKPGDLLLVTGALGGSIRGRHLSFLPRVREAQWLQQNADLHAMLDLSDGLASDIRHLARESKVGVIIDAGSLPIHDDVPMSLPRGDRVRHALSDGEDFELLFAVSPEDARALLARTDVPVPLTCIGEVIDGDECLLRHDDGSLGPLPVGGWEHRLT